MLTIRPAPTDPVLQSTGILFLHRLCDAICNVPIVSGPEADPHIQATTDFALSPSRTADTHTWQLAQAAGFCLSAHLLARPLSLGGEKPSCLLSSVQWFCLTDYRGHHVGTGDAAHRLVMLHALANRAVGFFYQELCWARANNRLCGSSHAGLMQPPTAYSLPWPTLYTPPVPFTPHGLEHFSTGHLSSMTEPSFFVDDEWTGYTCNGLAKLFDGVGGDNSEVFHNRLDEVPNDEFPFRVERVIRFRLVRQWDSNNKYLLQSNCFQTQATIQILKVTVDKATGHLAISHSRWPRMDWLALDAVITPFGIVEAVYPRGSWSWFWKCKWSGMERH